MENEALEMILIVIVCGAAGWAFADLIKFIGRKFKKDSHKDNRF